MRVIVGYFLLALSVVLFASLLSFNPSDSALLSSAVNQPPENIAGALGVWMSTPLVILYGRWSAFLLNFGLLVIGVNLVIRAKVGRILIKAVLFFMSSISLSVILAVLVPGGTYADAGIFGISIARSLVEIMHPYIVAAIFILIFILSLSSTMKLFQKMTFGVARLLGLVVLAPFELFGLIGGRNKNKEEEKEEVFADPRQEESFRYSPGPAPEDGGAYKSPSPDILSSQVTPDPEEGTFAGESGEFEPDFLRTGSGGPRKETSGQTAVTKQDAGPGWLNTDTDKANIMDSIRRKFDNEIGIPQEKHRGPASGITVREYLPEVPGEIQSPKEPVSEEPVIIEEAPMIITQETDEETAESPVLAIDASELDAITGEADYTLIAKKKRSRQSEKDEEKTPADADDEVREYIFPGANALEKNFDEVSRVRDNQEIERVSRVIENTFSSFKIDIQVSGHSRGPAITRYEIVPPSGLKLKNIVNLTDDLALNLGTKNIRIVGPIGNKSIIGVEVPNQVRRNVVLREIIDSDEFKESKAKLPLVLGKDIAGNIVIEDLTDMPHLLIAGTTGSGKSVYVNSLIGGIVFTRSSEDVKFIFIDPKMVELELYNGIPHLLTPVITAPEEAIAVLEWASAEVDRRFKSLSEYGVRNITDYNKEVKKINAVRRKNKEALLENFPYIIIVIDEFANLMLRLPKETEKVISKIAAMARAVGIHLVVATQRPSVDVVTGIIKANFPSRIAFRVASAIDSRTILDKNGADKLLGKGDMLFMTPNFNDMIRIQTPFISTKDVESLVRELKRNGKADYKLNIEELMRPEHNGSGGDYDTDYQQDTIFKECLSAAVENGEVSASYLQRRFRIGYNRASRIMDAMERMNILGPSTGTSKPREVLIGDEELKNLLQRPPA